jgi:flagellar basal-body rod modification protein FlgD
MEIQTVGTGATGLAASGALGGALEKDDFLRLLITQLSHQDPLNPMDNEAMVAQLAQFSSLEQMQNLNASAETQSVLLQSLGHAMTTQMIGRHLVASSAAVTYGGSGSIEVGVHLAGPASDVTVSILDGSGQTVAVIDASNLPAGTSLLAWDGTDGQGGAAPAGEYGLRITAAGSDGAPVSGVPVIGGRIDSVTFEQGQIWLVVNGQRIPLGSVLEVGLDSNG